MKTTARRILSLLVLAAALPVLGSRAAGDEPAPADSPAGLWVFDLRVVQVVTTWEAAEAAPAFEPAGPLGATNRAAWPDILAALKARGTTTILLDQRVTALPGLEAKVQQTQERLIAQFQGRDTATERRQAGVIATGVKANLVAYPGLLRYEVEARYDLPVGLEDLRPKTGVTSWNGTHPALSGETLVLRHREQIPAAAPPCGFEVYALLTTWFVVPGQEVERGG